MLNLLNTDEWSSDCQASPEAPVASYIYCVPALESYSNTNLETKKINFFTREMQWLQDRKTTIK